MRVFRSLSGVLVLSSLCSCQNARDAPAEPVADKAVATDAPRAEPAAASSALTVDPAQPNAGTFDDARARWVGAWPTTSRVTNTTCKQWPMEAGDGVTEVVRHNETVFEVRRMNGWSGFGTPEGDELTLRKSWKASDGAPIALTLKVRFEGAKRFVMTTEIVVEPWPKQPDGCETYLEEVGNRS